jgi:thioredoxin 1
MQGEGPLNRGEVEEIETKSRTALFAEKIKFKNFEQVLDCFHGEPIIIYFSTVHCGPCQLMKKELKQVQTQLGEDMKMFNVDTEKWPKIASRLQVATLPCLVVFREGEIKLRLEGVTSADSIIEHLDSFL